MANVFKRPEDKAKGELGKWTISYKDSSGKFRTKVGFTSKAETQRLAAKLELEAAQVREGLVDPAVARRKEEDRRPIGEHLAEFVGYVEGKGGSAQYCRRIGPEVSALLALAGVATLGQLKAPAIQAALGRMKKNGLSARTVNYHRARVKSFVAWLDSCCKVDPDLLRAMKKVGKFNEAADRRLVRRALTPDEVARLMAAVEASQARKVSRNDPRTPERWMSGPERAALYRLALGTGFRVNELRSLRAGDFRLDGAEPTVTLGAAFSKNGQLAVQPITTGLAAKIRPFIAGRPPEEAAFPVPSHMGRFLRKDLELAKIPFETAEGVVDFHALRHTFITHLVASGVQPKVAQVLARHSTIVLTMDRYAHAGRSELRAALDRGDVSGPGSA